MRERLPMREIKGEKRKNRKGRRRAKEKCQTSFRTSKMEIERKMKKDEKFKGKFIILTCI